MNHATPISVAVEGVTDEAVARRLIDHVGGRTGHVYGKQGKPRLRQQINGYTSAARFTPWLVLVDLDHDAHCAPPLRDDWISDSPLRLCFRIAVRAIETWLLADRERLAVFLGVSRGKLPETPETLNHPKQALVNVARRSRKPAVRIDMVPREGSGRSVGPAYASRLMEFTAQHWQPAVAAKRSDSLRRAIVGLRRLVETT